MVEVLWMGEDLWFDLLDFDDGVEVCYYFGWGYCEGFVVKEGGLNFGEGLDLSFVEL